MVPVLYSALTTRTPRMPMVSWARNTPVRLVRMGSKFPCPSAVLEFQVARLTAAAMTPTAMPTTTVSPMAQMVERTARSFVHSERTSPESP